MSWPDQATGPAPFTVEVTDSDGAVVDVGYCLPDVPHCVVPIGPRAVIEYTSTSSERAEQISHQSSEMRLGRYLELTPTTSRLTHAVLRDLTMHGEGLSAIYAPQVDVNSVATEAVVSTKIMQLGDFGLRVEGSAPSLESYDLWLQLAARKKAANAPAVDGGSGLAQAL